VGSHQSLNLALRRIEKVKQRHERAELWLG